MTYCTYIPEFVLFISRTTITRTSSRLTRRDCANTTLLFFAYYFSIVPSNRFTSMLLTKHLRNMLFYCMFLGNQTFWTYRNVTKYRIQKWILSFFCHAHLHIDPNLYEFFCLVKHKSSFWTGCCCCFIQWRSCQAPKMINIFYDLLYNIVPVSSFRMIDV